MKRTAILFAIALMVFYTGSAWAGNGNGSANGTGKGNVTGNATGNANSNGHGSRVGGFIDENGDGFNDLAPDADGTCLYGKTGSGAGRGFNNGSGNGTCPYGQTGNGPGTGQGTCPQSPGGGQFGSGTCDGTGPHGSTGRARR